MCFLSTTFPNAPPPPPILFDQSLNNLNRFLLFKIKKRFEVGRGLSV